MKMNAAIAALVFGLAVVAVYGSRLWVADLRAQTAARAVEQTASWAQAARMAASVMIERYGPPREISSYQLRWDGPWPWKRIVVRNEPQAPLEQVVKYDVPADKLEALMSFPHGLSVYADEGALGARGGHETLNRLSLNLANDIATGKMTPEEANSYFVRIVRLRDAGKSSPYLERLLFDIPMEPERSYPMP